MGLTKKLRLGIILFIGLIAQSNNSYGQACNSTPWQTYVATACNQGYYFVGCQVTHNGKNYTSLVGHFNIEPGVDASWATYWSDDGACGGSPPILDPTTSSDNDCTTGDVAGEITSDGGTSITERGFVWNTTGSPEITDNKEIEGGTAVSAFSMTLTGLTENSTIYVRAYATNSGGDTGYGTEVSFNTGTCATVTTTGPYDEYCEAFTAGLNTTAKGYAYGGAPGSGTLTELGFIYGTNLTDVTNARIDDLGTASSIAHIADNAASLITGNKYTQIDGLSPSTTYYYKSYATTAEGTGYGSVVTVTTQSACVTYYSCATFETYDTDPTCSSPGDSPTSNSIIIMRNDWRVSPGTALTDIEDVTDASVVNHFTATPFRIVIQDGGFVYRKNNFNSGTQMRVEAGGQFGFDGSMNMVTDGAESAGAELAKLEMAGGSFIIRTGFTNKIKIEGTGEICKKGAFSNTVTEPGSIYGDYSIPGSWPYTRYGTAECVGDFVQPVELYSFDGFLTQSNESLLSWVTLTEENNDFFTLYRSTNGIDFEEITVINGSGTTSLPQTYSFVDETTPGGIVYYQLTQTDFDGTTEMIGMVVVDNNGVASLEVFPNPTSGKFSYKFSGPENEKEILISVIDELGRTLTTRFIESSDKVVIGDFDLSDYADGVYVIQAKTTNNVVTSRIVKN